MNTAVYFAGVCSMFRECLTHVSLTCSYNVLTFCSHIFLVTDRWKLTQQMEHDNAGVALRLVKPHEVTTNSREVVMLNVGKHAPVNVAWETPQNLDGGLLGTYGG